jgi:hypothetical protein
MVTAELAVATLAALAVLTMLSWCVFLLVSQMRLIDTAGEVARQAARRDHGGVERAKQEAPPGAEVRVSSGPQTTSVVVRWQARPFAGWLVPVPLHAEAEVVTEPSAAPQ